MDRARLWKDESEGDDGNQINDVPEEQVEEQIMIKDKEQKPVEVKESVRERDCEEKQSHQ